MPRYGKDIKVAFELLREENRHYTDGFSYGNKSIDSYFRSKALSDKTSVTYLYIDTDADELISCVTVACSAIFNEEDDQEEQQFSTILSAMEIKYFATNKTYQHIPYSEDDKNISLSDMMFDFMLQTLKDISQNVIGAAKIVLYSVKRAVSFYERHDFKDFGNTMYGDRGYYVSGCKPMYLDLN